MLKDLSIEQFLDELKSEAAIPGGGGAAALCSAQGTALLMMVANLTVKKPKYEKWHPVCKKALAEGDVILEELVACIDDDAEAFRKVISKDVTDEDLFAATEIPLSIMRLSKDAMALAENLKGNSNPNLESDLLIAIDCLRTGFKAAKYNVDANLPQLTDVDAVRLDKIKNEVSDLV